jgi:hypothetical protein
MAGYLIINENTRERTRAQVRETLRRVEEKWLK